LINPLSIIPAKTGVNISVSPVRKCSLASALSPLVPELLDGQHLPRHHVLLVMDGGVHNPIVI
jgi:hypothetical protein